MISRSLARVGATAVCAAIAVGLAPAPAHAAGTDLGINLTGTSLAAGADFKFATLTITNHGTTRPDAVDIVIDSTRLDSSKIEANGLDGRCRPANGVTTCRLPSIAIPRPGGSAEQILSLEKVPGATGDAGSLTVTIRAVGDTDNTNDSRTATVAIGDGNADLLVSAQDVTAADHDDAPSGRPVAPGAIGSLGIVVVNQGDMTAAGVSVQITLPHQSTVAERIEGCHPATDGRSLTCVAADVDLLPLSKEPSSEDAFLLLMVPVRVSPEAEGPVTLKAGVVTVAALDRKPYTQRRTEATAALPPHYARPNAGEIAALDADWTDNTDTFAVHVAGPATGTGGGATDGYGGAGTGGGPTGSGPGGSGQAGGGLPVTGPTVFAFGGAGLAVVALGVGLLMAARHRRIVVAVPRDER